MRQTAPTSAQGMGQLVAAHPGCGDGHGRQQHRRDTSHQEIVCIVTTFDSGPAIANDTGMNASDTKKSRLETRPSISVGTRRCSSVPQMTMPAPSVKPMTNVATAINGNDEVYPTTTSRMDPSPHIAIITDI